MRTKTKPKWKLTRYARALKTLVALLGACTDKHVDVVNPRNLKDALKRFNDDQLWWFYYKLLDNDLIAESYINVRDDLKYSHVFKKLDADGLKRITTKLLKQMIKEKKEAA
jgi:hypothetical protein